MPRPRIVLRPTRGLPLMTLLTADRFRLGPRTSRVLAHLRTFGGTADDQAAAWIGDDLPPLGSPSITLGGARGSLGPHSFGFLNNLRGIAPYAAALPVRPPPGSVAIVCGRRDLLPEVAPLAIARQLGVSWIISVGDGDAAETLAFLGEDSATQTVLLAASTSAASLKDLRGKSLLVLGGEPLLRAAARRAGGMAFDDLEAWLAQALLRSAGIAHRPARLAALIAGGGAPLVRDAARNAGLAIDLQQVDDEDPDDFTQAAQTCGGEVLLFAGGTPPPSARPTLRLDLHHPAQVRALLRALAELEPASTTALPPAAKVDRAYTESILEEAGTVLADHDTKRLLKAYGVAVTRQAPASSATAATRVAAQLDYPVDLIAEHAEGAPSVRRAHGVAEVRRIAAVMLQRVPFVLVRQGFPASPRARLSIRRNKLGWVAELGGEQALLPLRRADARVLAHAASEATDEAQLTELLLQVATAATAHQLSLEVELFVGDIPTVVAARSQR